MPSQEFEEIKVEPSSSCESYKIEIVWDDTKIIRFENVDVVVDFLKKIA